MDWNLKAAAWHLSEFERDPVPNIIHTFDRSSSSANPRTRGEFSIDLRLGQIGSPGDKTTSKVKQPGILKMESSPSGTAKRARGASNGAQAMCLVDGCNSDLSTCRDYHRRHKVCERHSKSPQVTIGGQKQRFCQQCSRFHSLEEFDEGKRSCRKRLDGHNRRRRKPPPDPLPHTGRFLSSYQGTQLLPYSSSHAYPSAAVVNPTWSAVVNEADARNYNLHRQIDSSDKHSFFLGSSTSSFKGGKQFPFLQSDILTIHEQTSPGGSVCQPLLRSITLSESIGVSSSHSMLCDSLTTQAGDSDCALSLLSSTQTQASGNHMLQPRSAAAPLVQRIDSRQHHHSLATTGSVLVSNTTDAPIDCQGVLHFQSGNKAPHPLPFLWQ